MIASMLVFTMTAYAQAEKQDSREQLWQSFLTPPDSIRVGCYYYWVNEQVDPKGVVADLQWMKDNGITLAFLATDIRNRTRWENPWDGQTFGKNKFQSKLWWKNLHTALKTAGKLGIEMGLFNGATDCRILNDGTKIRFTEESLFEVIFPDGRQEYWNPAQPQPSAIAIPEQLQFSKAIVSGVSWYDQQGKTVSAHGANIIRDGGKYYLFGEYKTDSANVFKGFSCYSSENLVDWHFEGIAFNQQSDGRMGPYRVGERPKVLRCPATGEYVMLMHTDNLQYKDPCTCYATSQAITGPYKFQGPLLYKGEPVRKWDIGSFADDDGHAYLLVHHGIIYRLASDFHSLDSCLMNGLKGAGESPAMLKKDGTYYWLSSHTTSWERNDNMYWTSKSLSGPWEYRGEFCPKGSLTWNSQCSFVLPLENGSFMYMGDRWSFPRQRSAATYVWQPLTFADGKLTIPQYFEAWDPLTMQQEIVDSTKLHERKWQSQVIGDCLSIPYTGHRIALYGTTDSMSGYADITIRDQRGHKVFGGIVDFYSLVPVTGIRFLSPMLAKGKYTLELRIAEMKPNWTDKRRNQYGSTGHKVEITHVMIE